MGKKNHKKTIRTLMKRINEHREKIRKESEKEFLNRGRIHHWEAKIAAFEKGIKQAYKRLGR